MVALSGSQLADFPSNAGAGSRGGSFPGRSQGQALPFKAPPDARTQANSASPRTNRPRDDADCSVAKRFKGGSLPPKAPPQFSSGISAAREDAEYPWQVQHSAKSPGPRKVMEVKPKLPFKHPSPATQDSRGPPGGPTVKQLAMPASATPKFLATSAKAASVVWNDAPWAQGQADQAGIDWNQDLVWNEGAEATELVPEHTEPVKFPEPPELMEVPPPEDLNFDYALRENQKQLDEHQRRLMEYQADQDRRQEQDRLRVEIELKHQAEDLQRQQMELNKLEAERIRQEKEDQAVSLQGRITELLAVAEAEAKTMQDLAAPLMSVASLRILKDETIVKIADRVEVAKKKVAESMKAVSQCMAGKHKEMSGVTEESKREGLFLVQRASAVERGLAVVQGKVVPLRAKAQQRVETEARRANLQAEAKRLEQLFKQFDTDNDGVLKLEDIIPLARQEYDSELEESRIKHILNSECFKPLGRVPFSKFGHLRTLLNIAQNEVYERRKREVNQKRRNIVDKQNTSIEANAKIALECFANIEAEVLKAERRASPLLVLQHRKLIVPAEVEPVVADVELAVEAAKDFIAMVQEQLATIGGQTLEDLEPEAKLRAEKHTNMIRTRIQLAENRLTRSEGTAKTARLKIELHLKKEELLREATMMQ